jgi:hypothetical protein
MSCAESVEQRAKRRRTRFIAGEVKEWSRGQEWVKEVVLTALTTS